MILIFSCTYWSVTLMSLKFIVFIKTTDNLEHSLQILKRLIASVESYEILKITISPCICMVGVEVDGPFTIKCMVNLYNF